MSQRSSGYRRKKNDLYETPAWVTRALLPHVPKRVGLVWEPAAGSGKMARVLRKHYRKVYATDMSRGKDFLDEKYDDAWKWTDAVITNPPYKLAKEFIECAMRRKISFIALLLRTDYDHAKTRRHLFKDNPHFAKKVVLTKRIVWFKPKRGKKGKSPSFNHCWMVWDSRHRGPPTIAYGP